MAAPNEDSQPAANLQDALNQERGWIFQLTKKVLDENRNLDYVDRCTEVQQKESEEKYGQEEQEYKETIEQLEMRNRILESIATDYNDKMMISRRSETAQKAEAALLKAEKIACEARNQDLVAKNEKLEEEVKKMATLLAEKGALPQASLDQLADGSKSAEKPKEMDPYEAELADLNTDLNTLQKEVDELSERFAEKKNSALAAQLYEEVLKSAEKELYTCRTNYEIDQEKWKNKEAKYNQELEQIEKEKADLKSELQT